MNQPEPEHDLAELLRDTGYAVVGISVLWFQRAQVLRRQLTRDLPALPDLPDVRKPLVGAACAVAHTVEGTIRSVLAASPLRPPKPEPGVGQD